MSPSKILFFVTGSIAGFKAAQLVSRLVQLGYDVQCVASTAALKFVGAATFEGLTGRKVLTDLFEEGHAMDHIHLSREAQFGVVCPASANILGQVAGGLASDLVSTMIRAWPDSKPLYIFPSMNTAMWNSPVTKEHIERLKGRGFFVSETDSGHLACGEIGAGRLLEPEEILKIILPQSKGRVLVTGGATRESIDGIRFLSNVSTGQTAAKLADEFSKNGFEVTYLHGAQAAMPSHSVKSLLFSNTQNLQDLLHGELARHDYVGVVHAAAVSDYTIDHVNGSEPDSSVKLTSDNDLSLTLRPTTKILPKLREFSKNKKIHVIGFKLTLHADSEEQDRAAIKILQTDVSAVVVNDWSEVTKDRARHPGYLRTLNETVNFSNLQQLSKLLIKRFEKDDL